jgi:hypothetical protein
MFPLFLGLLPPSSPHLGPMLDALSDPEQLWSPYGLRSLSAAHPEFGQGENYWKGPVWVQMNYLALRSLYKVPLFFIRFLETKYLTKPRNTLRRKGRIRPAPRRFTASSGRTLSTMCSR